jgi:hypothetical protein
MNITDTQLELSLPPLKKLSDLYEYVAKLNGVEPEAVKQVIESHWQYIANHIRNRQTDDILINKFGTLEMKPAVVDNIMRGLIKKYREGKLEREKLTQELSILFPIRNKLKKKKKPKRAT